MKRVIFYYDGFNFYNGLRAKSLIDPHWKNYYWLDLVKFSSQFFLENGGIDKVKYFTSPPHNPKKKSKQSALFSANSTINKDKFEVIMGQYNSETMFCNGDCKREFEYLSEKRTDVNIALTMFYDCYKDIVDTLVLVCADSDQIPTIKMIKAVFPEKKIKVYFPPERNSTEILSIAKPIVFLNEHEAKFKISMLPGIVINDDTTKTYHKPDDWKR